MFKVFTSLLLSIFGLFLISPQIALGNESKEIFIVSSGISDTCTWSIACEKVSETQYICRSSGELLSNLGTSIHQIPMGKSGTDTPTKSPILWSPKIPFSSEKKSTYRGPAPFVYPFVRVTKIQV